MTGVLELVARLSVADPAVEPIAGIDGWWARHRGLGSAGDPFARAVAGGFAADRLGYAFASGYHEALRALFPIVGDPPRSLAATEDGPPDPQRIVTALDGGTISGAKGFATLGTIAEVFLVAASRGKRPDGRADLAMVAVPRDREGVRVEDGPTTTFIPEIPHARVVLDGVRVREDEILPGDGWTRYLKPFRTVEDCHVHGATLGYLYACARRFVWGPFIDPLVAQILAVARIASSDPSDACTHLALASVLGASRDLIERLDADGCWARADALTRERWERDRPLLKVAGAAREARLKRARARLAGRAGE